MIVIYFSIGIVMSVIWMTSKTERFDDLAGMIAAILVGLIMFIAWPLFIVYGIVKSCM